MARLRTHRRAVAAGLVALVIVVALAIGLAEGGTGSTAPEHVPTLAEARADVTGAPPSLARLYATPGGTAASGGVPVLRMSRARFQALLRSFRGRPALVNVWYPTCAPCQREFPIMQTAAARYGKRMAFLGVVTQDPDAEIDAFLKAHPTVYPHVRDKGAQFARADLEAGLSFPSTVLIDRNGAIVDVKLGEYTSLPELEHDLARLGIRPQSASTTTTGGPAR